MENYNLDVAQRLMLAQGISLIEDGLQFLEWTGLMPNECAFDALTILRDRVQYFKDCAFDEDIECNHLFVDKAKSAMNNVEGLEEDKGKSKILEQIKQYREEVVKLSNQRKEQE